MTEDQRRDALRATASAGSIPEGLARACLLIARGENPALDVEASLERVRGFGERVRSLYAEAGGAPWRSVSRVLGDEEEFLGDTEDYDAPENSYLDRVLERHSGLPILLSVLWVDVARCAGLSADGIGLPGHFIASVGQGDQRTYVDPFAGGRPLSAAEALAKAAAAVGMAQFHADPAWLQPAGAQGIVLRVLNNLAASYERRGDHRRTVRVLSDLLAVEPMEGRALARRGIAYARTGETQPAMADLQAALDLLPAGGPLHERARSFAARLARRSISEN